MSLVQMYPVLGSDDSKFLMTDDSTRVRCCTDGILQV